LICGLQLAIKLDKFCNNLNERPKSWQTMT
jgi:hypothetical protein